MKKVIAVSDGIELAKLVQQGAGRLDVRPRAARRFSSGLVQTVIRCDISAVGDAWFAWLRGLMSILTEEGQPVPTECIVHDALGGVMNVVVRVAVPIGGEIGYNLWFSQIARSSESRAILGFASLLLEIDELRWALAELDAEAESDDPSHG